MARLYGDVKADVPDEARDELGAEHIVDEALAVDEFLAVIPLVGPAHMSGVACEVSLANGEGGAMW